MSAVAKIKPVCPNCHSDNVICDANAEWDETAQAWTLRAAFDDCWCCDCEAEINPDWQGVAP